MFRGTMDIVIGALIFGLVPSGYKYAMLNGVTPAGMTCYSFAFMTITSIALAAFMKKTLRISGKQLCYLIFLGAVGIGATTFFVNAAITLIPVGVVTMIQFMYPTVVTVAMATIFREKLTKKKIGTVLLAIAGLVLVSDISGGSVDKRGILLALCASFTYAFYIISNERSCISGLPLPIKLTYAGLGCSVVFGIVACSGAGMGFPNTQMSCIIMLVTCLGNMAAYYLIALGISRIGALRASLIDMMEPVFSVLFSFLIYHDKITLTMLGGIAMILISVMIASRSDVET